MIDHVWPVIRRLIDLAIRAYSKTKRAIHYLDLFLQYFDAVLYAARATFIWLGRLPLEVLDIMEALVLEVAA